MKKDERIEKALEIAYRYGMIDGEHHKQWIITQMVKLLLDDDEAFKKWKKRSKGYSPWNEGIAP